MSQFQLERWTGREYEPHGPIGDKPGQKGDTARMLGLPRWRVVDVSKARPRKVTRITHRSRNPRGPSGPGLSPTDQIVAYLRWARDRGLERVTVYRGKAPPLERIAKIAEHRAAVALPWIGNATRRRAEEKAARERARDETINELGALLANAREVDPADFLGPAPEPETIAEGE